MLENRNISGDFDGVYTDNSATCYKIMAYVLSKGDLKTNSISNKFCNIEILRANRAFYLAVTSGRLGSDVVNVVVRRFSSDVIVRKYYLEECKNRLKEKYTEVEVVSIYPNCSLAAQNFVAQKNIISAEEAEAIVQTAKSKNIDIDSLNLKASTSSVKSVDELDSKVSKFVETVYYEASQTLKKSLNPSSFQCSSTPLGMINLNMINKGRGVLKEISELQNKLVIAKRVSNIEKYRESICNLSNIYNSTIPRVLKRGTDVWLLDTGEKIMEQYDLLDMLELGLSNAVLNSNYEVDTTSKYLSLNSDIRLVTDPCILNKVKEKMVKEQLHNHHLNTKLVNLFEINQKNAPSFDSSCGNVVSLFHGTKGANLLGILSSSLKLPINLGSNVQLTGAMFGPGVYFGAYSKSLQYSSSRFSSVKNKTNKYYLFLCDVALGKLEMTIHSKYFSQAPTGTHSVMAVGDSAFKSGCLIRGIGDVKDFNIPSSYFNKKFGNVNSPLLHNEFVLYNQNRYRIRYILEVEAVK